MAEHKGENGKETKDEISMLKKLNAKKSKRRLSVQRASIMKAVDKKVIHDDVQLWHGTLKDGRKYYGQVDNEHHLPNGIGYLEYIHGGSYFGDVKDGMRSGLGVYNFPTGMRYAGEFEQDQRHGCGVSISPCDGLMYRGEWNLGDYHGLGELIYLEEALSCSGVFVRGCFDDNQDRLGTDEMQQECSVAIKKAIEAQFKAESRRNDVHATTCLVDETMVNTVEFGGSRACAKGQIETLDKLRKKQQTFRDKEVRLQVKRTSASTKKNRVLEATYAAEQRASKQLIANLKKELETVKKWKAIHESKKLLVDEAQRLLVHLQHEKTTYQ